MAANENLITVKVIHPDPDVDNREITFPVSDENWETFNSYVSKAKIDGFTMRTLTPRNRYGAAGMPIEVKREKLLAQLAELGIDVSKLAA